ncbi:MAG: acyl-CoA thioesterase II [Actinomycetales bacterium]|nr:acyl-CoA thioesterase II [Actinomycetales bacterium]
MSEPLAGFLAALALTDTGARTDEDIFTGPSQYMPGGRVFGGQVLAQSLVAAARTVPEDRAVHSMHGYFLRPGDVTLPITFAVDRIHDGRSFATRRTQAYQSGQPILSMIASFQDLDPGVEHQEPMPEGLPDPESLPSAAELLSDLDHPAAKFWANERAFDIRHIEPAIYLRPDGERRRRQAIWFRAVGELPDDPMLHRAALAYASDFAILEPVLRAHGLSWVEPGISVASLDHAMWWHREARADEWLLYLQESPNAIGGRGLSFGRIYTRDGRLAVTIAQEGMVRVPDPSGR